jgi:hypothetical protein
MSARLSPSISYRARIRRTVLAEGALLPHAIDDQIGDRIGDNPRAIRSNPLHDEQFVLAAYAHDGPNELSPI